MVTHGEAVVGREHLEGVLITVSRAEGVSNLVDDQVGAHQHLAALAQVEAIATQARVRLDPGRLVADVFLVEGGSGPGRDVCAVRVILEAPEGRERGMPVGERDDDEQGLVVRRLADDARHRKTKAGLKTRLFRMTGRHAE